MNKSVKYYLYHKNIFNIVVLVFTSLFETAGSMIVDVVSLFK